MIEILEAEGVIDAIDVYLEDLGKGLYFKEISKSEQHWRKCIKAKQDYIEK